MTSGLYGDFRIIVLFQGHSATSGLSCDFRVKVCLQGSGLRVQVLGVLPRRKDALQGYLAHQKQPPPRTLQ